ncbi:uncharacterized protein BDW70DRAFT_138061 [Aspergillus foveolatus]|uniref:uncharacterized protein n=1 Tax=Aspergillus foveolatus TaxID=210207 RepID=UPI003CCC9C49
MQLDGLRRVYWVSCTYRNSHLLLSLHLLLHKRLCLHPRSQFRLNHPYPGHRHHVHLHQPAGNPIFTDSAQTETNFPRIVIDIHPQ